jgi:hypothetical protein
LCNLGVAHTRGTGVADDYHEDVRLYTKVAEQGDAIAQANLATAYASGRVFNVNFYKQAYLTSKNLEDEKRVVSKLDERISSEMVDKMPKVPLVSTLAGCPRWAVCLRLILQIPCGPLQRNSARISGRLLLGAIFILPLYMRSTPKDVGNRVVRHRAPVET